MEEWLSGRLRTQFGLIGRWQCLAAGLSTSAIGHRVQSGEWERVAAGVYRLAGHPASFEQTQMIAVLAGHGRPVVSHRAAARVWDLDGPEWSRPEVTVLPGRRLTSVPGLVAHQGPEICGRDLFHAGELPVTAPARTLLDLGQVTTDEWVEHALESAIRQGRVSFAYLRDCLDRASRRGRRGLGALRRALDVRGDVPATESELETRFFQAIREAG